MTSLLSEARVVANLVILSRAAEKGKTALLLEGNKDHRLYAKVVDPAKCRTFRAGNRAKAEEAVAILKAHGEKGVLAVVDADTDYLAARLPNDLDVLLTHTRDSEGMLLTPDAVRGLLIEFDLDINAFGMEPELKATAAAASVGVIRYIVERQGWSVLLSQIDFSAFIDPSDLSCDERSLCRHIAGLTRTASVKTDDYGREIQILSAANYQPPQVARGHDVTNLLAWAISKRSGKKRKEGAPITGDVIESYLRTAYTAEAFAITELFQKIRGWETRNAPYQVLR